MNRRCRPYLATDSRTVAKFWAKVSILGKDDCWPWQGVRNPKGYGAFSAIEPTRHAIYIASRFAYQLTHGPVANDVFVLHSCDHPWCCNPAHMRLGSIADNSADMTSRERQSRGSKRPLSKLTEEQVLEAARLWRSGEMGQHEIAALFGVNQSQISRALSRKRWRHVETGTPARVGRRSCRVRMVTMDGVTKSLSEFIEELGLNAGVVRRRIQLGWSPTEALTRPLRKAG